MKVTETNSEQVNEETQRELAIMLTNKPEDQLWLTMSKEPRARPISNPKAYWAAKT